MGRFGRALDERWVDVIGGVGAPGWKRGLLKFVPVDCGGLT